MVKSLSILQSERVRAQGNSKHWKQKQTLKTKSCIILPTFTKKENIIPIKLIPHSVTSLKHYILDEDYLLHNAENGSFTGFFFPKHLFISLILSFIHKAQIKVFHSSCKEVDNYCSPMLHNRFLQYWNILSYKKLFFIFFIKFWLYCKYYAPFLPVKVNIVYA